MLNNKKRNALYFILFILLTLFIRGSVLFYHLDTFNDDPDNYGHLAVNLKEFHVFGTGENPTAFRPPLYPYLLSLLSFLQIDPNKSDVLNFFLLSRNAAIALFHWILGLLTVLLVYRIALQCRLSKRAACWSGLLVAVDPILLQQSRLVMTETLAAFFAAFLIFLLIKIFPDQVQLLNSQTSDRSNNISKIKTDIFPPFFPYSLFGVGLIFGVAVLCRPTFLAFAGLLTLFFIIPVFSVHALRFFSNKRFSVIKSILVSLGLLILYLIGLSIPLSFWAYRNEKVFGQPILTTTHSGYTFLLANNDFVYNYYNDSRPWLTLWNPEEFHADWTETVNINLKKNNKPPITAQTAELYQDDLAKKTAWYVIERRPWDFAKSIIYRTGNLWQCLPYCVSDPKTESFSIRWARYAIGLFYLIELGLAFAGTLVLCCSFKRKIDWSSWICGFLFILSIQIPHLFFWTNMRMRAPLMIFVPLLAVYGFYSIKQFLSSHSSTHSSVSAQEATDKTNN